MDNTEKFFRRPAGGKIAGVCAGVAEHHKMNPDTVRLMYDVAQLCGFPMILVYLFQWLVYPVR